MFRKRYKKLFLALLILFSFLAFSKIADAQMMEKVTPMMQQGNITPSAQDVKDIQTGQDLYSKFQSKQTSCSQLRDGDFEKIGEYLMNQSFGGNSNAHIQMNNTMKQMIGENGEEQMHIRLAKNATGCSTNGQGSGNNIMGWGNYGIPFLIQSAALIDLILVGVWLWKKIQK